MIRSLVAGLSEFAVARPPQGARAMPAAAWVSLGFLAGILFWHLVGFWSFVTAAVFKGDEDIAIVSDRASPVARQTEPLRTRSHAAAGPATQSCVALVLDRLAGTTREAPCPAATFHHRNAGLGVKRDREPGIRLDDGQGVAGWATRLDEAETADIPR